VRSLVVSICPEEDITAFSHDQHAGLGDFVILTDEALPRSFEVHHPL
jgi:hypothetical protein